MDDAHVNDEPRTGQWLLIAVFVAAIVAPGALGLVDPDRNAAAIRDELRLPEPFPPHPVDRETLEAFPSGFDEWFDDHFGARTALIRAHSLLKFRVFGVSPSERVTFGHEDWMFIGKTEYTHNHRATNPFTPEELDSWTTTLRIKHDWCAQRGIRYLFVIAPNKSTVYPEHMPEQFDRVGDRTRCDQLFAHLAEHTEIEVLDLRPVLTGAKTDGLLYYPLGSHWNDLGAYHAAVAIADRLRGRWFPGLGRDPLENYDLIANHGEGPDSWASRLHVTDHFAQEWTDLSRTAAPHFDRVVLGSDEGRALWFEQENAALPRAAVLRDSFGTALAPLLAPYFSRVVCYWQWRRKPHEIPDRLEKERPDVVIDLVVEQLLMSRDFHTRWASD